MDPLRRHRRCRSASDVRALFHLSDDDWTAAARVALLRALALQERGHRAGIVCCSGSAVERRAVAAGIDTILVDGGSSVISGTRDLRRLLIDNEVDLSFVNDERDQLVVSSAARFAQRGAVIRSVPAFQEIRIGRSGALALKLTPSMLLVSTAADAAGAPTRGWRLPPAIVPHATEPFTGSPATRADLSVPDGGVLIVCPYEPGGRARLATLFRALRHVAPRHPGVRAVVIGPGANDEELRMHASALGVSRLVRLMAPVDDPLPVLAAADVGWVVAGGDAGVLDALAFMTRGIPVIAERSPVTQQCVVDTVTGLLLAPAEPAYHASAVAGLLASAELRAAMGRAGKQRAQREFPWDNMVDALEKAATSAAELSGTRA